MELEKMEKEKSMRYVTSVERLGIKKGFEKGLKKGLEQGLEQGLEKGLEKGLQKGLQKGQQQGSLQTAREMILDMIAARFGIVTEDVARMVQEIQAVETLKSLLQPALKSENLDSFRQVLHEAKGK